MAAFTNSLGTMAPAFAVGGPSGIQLQSDPVVQAINILAANGILGPLRVGWAVGPNDAVSLYQLGAILSPPAAQADPTACLISPV